LLARIFVSDYSIKAFMACPQGEHFGGLGVKPFASNMGQGVVGLNPGFVMSRMEK
jgi:hypothetical protein